MTIPNELCWTLPSGGILLLEPDVYEIMSTYRQMRWKDKEAGGCLLGFYRGAHIHISACTTPMPLDQRKRTLFVRKDPGHVEKIEKFHDVTRGYGTYLGEWHTHPEPLPTPSGIDKREWEKICRQRGKLESTFLILGTDTIRASSSGDIVKFSSLPLSE